MIKISGKYVSAAVYSCTVEPYALARIKAICDHPAAADTRIAVMPDVHPGKVGPIGLVMTLGSKIMPHLYSQDFDFNDLICRKHVSEKKAMLSLGTLGGGNHFIEGDRDEEGGLYLFVHTGSRRLGKEVTEFYLKEGERGLDVPYEQTWLEGQLMEDYLHDVHGVQGFAMLNRKIILSEFATYMKWKVTGFGESIHNYVDENRILRKGAAAAYAENEVIIPVNMRDGIILGTGKGNPGWNFSVPHGAGRIVNRETIRTRHTVGEFKSSMKGIYSSTIGKETLDEVPFAYRGIFFSTLRAWLLMEGLRCMFLVILAKFWEFYLYWSNLELK